MEEEQTTAREAMQQETVERLQREWSEAAARHEVAVKREASRQRDMCKQVVGRMMRRELAGAFAVLAQSAQRSREQVARCRGVVVRLQRRGLAMAFDGLCAKVEESKRGREIVGRVLGKWRAPTMSTALAAWDEYMAICEAERQEAARAALSGELEHQSGILHDVIEIAHIL